MTMNVVVGIDVGAEQIEVGWSTSSATQSLRTDEAGLSQLVTWMQAYLPELIVLEASGGYERRVLRALWAAGMPVARINARMVRDFARATGRLAKTDTIDAGVLAQYGELLQPSPQPPPSAARQQLDDWQRRRRALVRMQSAEQNRLQQSDDPVVRASIEAMIAHCRAQIADLEARMDALIDAEAELQEITTLVQTVPGIGPVSARSLVGELPELGITPPKAIAALAGVAPLNRDSGQHRGKRSISGGRANLRSDLYMPMISCIEHNSVISVFYHRLRARGKPHKVALTAAMRKLLTILNAMVRDNLTWTQLDLNSS